MIKFISAKHYYLLKKDLKSIAKIVKEKKKEKRPLYNAMNKYGIEHFLIEEIEECDYNVVNDREKYWIEYYSSFKYGYNATPGGDGVPYLDYDLIISL